MGIPMANANIPAAGHGVLATQGAPVLAARDTSVAGSGDVDVFGVALQAEAVDLTEPAAEQADGAEPATPDAAVAEGIALFEDGDAADAKGRKGEGEAAADAEVLTVASVVQGPAMQAPQLPPNMAAARLMPTRTNAGDIALHLDTGAAAANVSLPILSLVPKTVTSRDSIEARLQDIAPAPAGAGAQLLPAGITLPAGMVLPSGMTLNLAPLLQAAGANATGLSSGNTMRNTLVEQLGERLHVQLTQRSEHAIIRLDPPSMGRIEILISQEAGNTQVQMRASNPEVARQLHAIGEQLRQDLVQRQHGEVSVQVQDSWREGEGRGRQRQPQQAAVREEPGRALREEDTEDGEASRFALQS